MSTLRLLMLLLLLGPLGCRSGLGDSCEEHKDCQHVDRGYCAVTGICVASCSVEGDLCSDGLCVATSSRTVCLPSCDRMEDCRPGEACLDRTGGRACVITDPLAKP